MPKKNVPSKIGLYEALSSHFSGKINAARIKFIGKFMIALFKVQTVNFQKLGSAFEYSAKPSSCVRSIQRFNELCYLSGKKIIAKDGSTEFLIIVSYNDPDHSMEYYQERWQIETCFKAMKSSGFDLEKTHVASLKRLKNLVLLVMMAFVWCYKVGIHLNKKEAPIKIKKHGGSAISVFKYGLNFLASLFLNPIKHSKTIRKLNIFQFLSCT